MLKCKEISEKASDIVDGKITGFDKVKVQMHLLMCKHCRSFISKIKLTRDVVNKLTFSPVSEDKIDKVMDRINEDEKTNPSE